MKAIAWIVTLLYVIVALFVWMCPVKGYCPDGFESMNIFSKTIEKPVSLPSTNASISPIGGFEYTWGEHGGQADTGLHNGLLRALEKENASEAFVGLTGFYHPNEPFNSDGFTNLGLARAHDARRMLISNGTDSSRIISTFSLLPDSVVAEEQLPKPGVVVQLLNMDQDWLDNNHTVNNIFRFQFFDARTST